MNEPMTRKDELEREIAELQGWIDLCYDDIHYYERAMDDVQYELDHLVEPS